MLIENINIKRNNYKNNNIKLNIKYKKIMN